MTRSLSNESGFGAVARRVLADRAAAKGEYDPPSFVDDHGRVIPQAVSGYVRSVKQLAGALGMSQDLCNKKLRGERQFTADEARDVIAAMQSLELADYFLGATDFQAAVRYPAAADNPHTLPLVVEHALSHWCALKAEVGEAVADDRLSADELDTISESVRALEALVVGMRLAIEARAVAYRPARDNVGQ